MGVGPPGSPCRRRSQTAVVSCRLRAGVGSDHGNGPLPAGQVGDEKTNVCEPLLTRRKALDDTETGRPAWPGTKGGPSGWPLSQGAACVWPWWCPAYRWREFVAGAGMEQENLSSRNRRSGLDCLAARGRTPRGRNLGGQSTARHRGGPARISDEGPVMGPERRGRAGQVTLMSTPWGRN